MFERVALGMGWFCSFFFSLVGAMAFLLGFSGINPLMVFSPVAAPVHIIAIWASISLARWKLRRS